MGHPNPMELLARARAGSMHKGSPEELTTKKGWSASGNVAVQRPGRGVVLQCYFNNNPEYYTLQFSATPPFAGSGGWIRTMAEIQWSVEGNSVRRLINIGAGVSISGTGQAVKVRIFDDSQGGTAGVEYPVSVQVTKGVRPNIEKPPILIDALQTLIAPTAIFGFDVPENSGVSALFNVVTPQNNAGAPIANDEIFGIFNNGATTVQIFGYDMCNKWIALPTGSREVQITNNRAAGDIFWSIIWGIEG